MLIDYLHKEVDKLRVAEYPNNAVKQFTLHRHEQLRHYLVRFVQAELVVERVNEAPHLDPLQVLAGVVQHWFGDFCPLVRLDEQVAQNLVAVVRLERQQEVVKLVVSHGQQDRLEVHLSHLLASIALQVFFLLRSERVFYGFGCGVVLDVGNFRQKLVHWSLTRRGSILLARFDKHSYCAAVL